MPKTALDAEGREFPATGRVDPNEGAIMYSELNLVKPWHIELHRYQVIKVIRKDAPAIYERDLGPAKDFPGVQVNVQGGQWNERTGKGKIWDTVGRLEGIGEVIRNRTEAEAEALMAMAGHELTDKSPEQWEEDFHKEADRRRLAVSKKGVSGPHFTKLR